MSATYVQGKSNGALDSTVVVTLDNPPVAGHFLVVAFNDGPATCDVASITDTAGNTYHAAGAIQRGTSDNWAIWYAYNVATADPFTITVEVANRSFPSVNVQEWGGVHTASDPLDDEAGASGDTGGAGHDFAVGPVTPTEAGALCIVGIHNFGFDAEPAALDEKDAYGYDTIYSGVLASADPYTALFSFGTSSYHVAKIALFRAPYEAWIDVPQFKVCDVDFDFYPGGTARVICGLWSAKPGVTMRARLYDITNAASLGMSPDVTSQTETDATFAVTASGRRRVKLQMTASLFGTDLFCAPDARVAA